MNLWSRIHWIPVFLITAFIICLFSLAWIFEKALEEEKRRDRVERVKWCEFMSDYVPEFTPQEKYDYRRKCGRKYLK